MKSAKTNSKQACAHDDITGVVDGEREGAWKLRLMGEWVACQCSLSVCTDRCMLDPVNS